MCEGSERGVGIRMCEMSKEHVCACIGVWGVWGSEVRVGSVLTHH